MSSENGFPVNGKEGTGRKMTTLQTSDNRDLAALVTSCLSLPFAGQVAYLRAIAWLQVRGGAHVPSRAELGATGKAHAAALVALARDGFCTRPRRGVRPRWKVRAR